MESCSVTEAMDLDCGAYFVSRSGRRRELYCCGCRTKRRGVEWGQKEVGRHVRLLLAAEGSFEMRME